MKIQYGVVAILAIAVVSAVIYVQRWEQLNSEPRQTLSGGEFRELEFKLVYHLSANGHRFYCFYIAYTESTCRLFVSDSSTNVLNSTSYFADSPQEAFVLSPDQNWLLLASEREINVLNTHSLDVHTIAVTSEDEEFGFHTSFPTFRPTAKWLDSRRVKISKYRLGTSEVEVENLKTISQYLLDDQVIQI